MKNIFVGLFIKRKYEIHSVQRDEVPKISFLLITGLVDSICYLMCQIYIRLDEQFFSGDVKKISGKDWKMAKRNWPVRLWKLWLTETEPRTRRKWRG